MTQECAAQVLYRDLSKAGVPRARLLLMGQHCQVGMNGHLQHNQGMKLGGSAKTARLLAVETKPEAGFNGKRQE